MTGLFERDYLTSLGFVSVGGFLEVYTFVTRGGIFANAQTGNIARIGIFWLRANRCWCCVF